MRKAIMVFLLLASMSSCWADGAEVSGSPINSVDPTGMTEEDFATVGKLRMFSSTITDAVLYVADKCHVLPSRLVVKVVSNTDSYLEAVRAFTERKKPSEPKASDCKDLQAVSSAKQRQ